MSLELSGNGVVTGLNSVGSSDLGTVLGSKLDLAGGKILQIVRATDSTQRTTTSTSFVDASISVTITPQKNDSAVLLLWSASFFRVAANEYLLAAITDNSNNVLSGAERSGLGSTAAAELLCTVVLVGYATPATTSATTYKGRFRSSTGNTVRLDNSTTTAQLYAIEVSA